MEFKLKGHSGTWSARVPLKLNELSSFSDTPLNFRTNLIPFLWVDDDKKSRLDLTWRHWVFYRDVELLEFHSYSQYYVVSADVELSDSSLETIITESYNYLRTAFEERRREYMIFEAIEVISEDTIQQTVSQLRSFLLDEPELQ